MLKRFQMALTTLRKEPPQTFEECVHTVSTHLSQSVEDIPPSPTPVFQENLLIMNSLNHKACVIDPQGKVELIDLNDLMSK